MLHRGNLKPLGDYNLISPLCLLITVTTVFKMYCLCRVSIRYCHNVVIVVVKMTCPFRLDGDVSLFRVMLGCQPQL